MRHALSAQKLGVDALTVFGREGGGHVGLVNTMTLVPGAVDALEIPVIAAGGIADARGLLAALALGLGFCWSNFGAVVTHVPEVKAKLGFGEDWRVITSAAIGYPKFKQQGMVPRMLRPITWIRPE